MRIINKLSSKFTFTLIAFHLIFFLSIIFVGGYPQNNDILHIFKISSLDNNLKFVNGAYGPGYTYYSLIFSNSLKVLSFFNSFLSILSSVLICIFLNKFFKNSNNDEKSVGYLFSLVFHLIILVTVGFNHSDYIFLLLFYNGILLFLIGYYLLNSWKIYYTGALIIGLSVLFRHHGLIFLFFLLILFFSFEIFFLKKKINLFIKDYFKIIVILIIPPILSYIHLTTIDAIADWQTHSKLHYYVYANEWNWRDVKSLFNSEDYKNFYILNVNSNVLIKLFFGNLHGALRKLYPFVLCFFLSYFLSKKKIILFSLFLFLLYVIVVLPGYTRGYYPAIFLCFFAVLLNYKEIAKKKIYGLFIFLFLFGHLIYLTSKFSNYIHESYMLNNDINKNIIPILNDNKIKYKNLFSDDYNFYTDKLDGKSNNLCNWGGWLLNHPYYKDYYPAQVAMGKKNKYCEIKAFITKEESIAKKYLSLGNFNNQYKTNIYYLLIKN
jgi:hypothetical protein|tara:strand:+ start:1236 stop:2711 length:1476 start_codon:yes stop_codon:yes gene_type:complete